MQPEEQQQGGQPTQQHYVGADPGQAAGGWAPADGGGMMPPLPPGQPAEAWQGMPGWAQAETRRKAWERAQFAQRAEQARAYSGEGRHSEEWGFSFPGSPH